MSDKKCKPKSGIDFGLIYIVDDEILQIEYVTIDCQFKMLIRIFFFYLKNQRNVCASVLNILINSKLPLGICCKGNIEVSH